MSIKQKNIVILEKCLVEKTGELDCRITLSPYLNVLKIIPDVKITDLKKLYNSAVTEYFKNTIEIIIRHNLKISLWEYSEWLWFLYFKDLKFKSSFDFVFPENINSDLEKFLYYNYAKDDNCVYDKKNIVYFDSFFYMTKFNITDVYSLEYLQIKSNRIIVKDWYNIVDILGRGLDLVDVLKMVIKKEPESDSAGN